MSFKHTKLWQAAFEQSRNDSNRDEQERLAACYKAMRERARILVEKISKDLPHLTVHDVTHLDALWEMASIACGDNVSLNTAEAFVFGGAILLHDSAMTLAAFPGGLAELKQTTEWKDLYARHSTPLEGQESPSAKAIEDRATEDALRLLHAKQAENLARASWVGPYGEPMFLIEDQQIRNFYGPKIGKIAHSHWWPIAKVEDELSGTLGALPDLTNNTVDLSKVACILRVADAMHLDQRRAPAFEYALRRPTGVSANHWKFQERMAKPYVHGDALAYTAQPPFAISEADAWWTAFDALQMLDRELRDVDRLLRDREKSPLAVRRVEGAHAPGELAKTVETVGWTPVDSTIRVSDVSNIVATLGGSKLYGENRFAPLRELIQNASDAIVARRHLQERHEKWGQLCISLDKREDGTWLSVEDNGVGMSTAVLTGALIDFGNSFWRSQLALEEFPGLAASGMVSNGKYGIGFFSVFMLGDQVRVVTRRYDADVRAGRVLEFRDGLASRPNLRNATSKEAPLDGGTRIEVKLRNDPLEDEGLLHTLGPTGKDEVLRFEDVVRSVAPALDVAITIRKDGVTVGLMDASDWSNVDSATLMERISCLTKSTRAIVELTPLHDEQGNIYGRAAIDPAGGWEPAGVITVGGLSACTIRYVSGVLVGNESVASRNQAFPILPASVLHRWATEQADIIAGADIASDIKAEAASIIVEMGGDIRNLPVFYYHQDWWTLSEFKSAVREKDEIIVHDGDIMYDDFEDNVSPREFELFFETDPGIVEMPSCDHVRFSAEWIRTVVPKNSPTLHEMLEEILELVWGGFDSSISSAEVGTVDGHKIRRDVTMYRRAYKPA